MHNATTPPNDDDDDDIDFDDLTLTDDDTGSVFDADDGDADLPDNNTPDNALRAVQYTGDLQADAYAEAEALRFSFRDRKRAQKAAVDAAMDREFYCVVVFQSRAQKEAWLSALDILEDGDKYVDGQLLAERQKISLPDARPLQRRLRPMPRFAALAQPLPPQQEGNRR